MADSNAPDVKVWHLKKEEELRFEVDFGSTVTLTLLRGTAEVFGTELAVGRKYTVSGCKRAVFTWNGAGCDLELQGNASHVYVAEGAPMIIYANIHSALEQRRIQAAPTGAMGPRVVVAGPTDTGKSTLSSILLGYATRRDHTPMFVDLDVGQGRITLPGVIACLAVDRPVDIEEGFNVGAPLAYFYGHTSPGKNDTLFKIQVEQLCKHIDTRLKNSKEAAASGVIVNSCGWIEGIGYELLLFCIKEIKADVVLVIDHDRLYNDLTMALRESSPKVEIVKIPKSGGVVARSPQFRTRARSAAIRNYFYGNGDLCPHSRVVCFDDISIYRIGGGLQAPQSALPIGCAPTDDPLRLTEVVPSSDLLHSVLGVSHAKTPQEIVTSNIAGCVYVNEVDFKHKKMTILAPSPIPLPGRYLILGSLKWLE